MMVRKGSKLVVKLIDFGLSKFQDIEGKKMHTRLGTPYYVSPEVLEGRYDKRCDLWSIGVMTYFLLYGYPPFNGESDMELFYKIKCCDFAFPIGDGDGYGEYGQSTLISDEAKEFISSLLRTNPDSRMTIEEALNHEWI